MDPLNSQTKRKNSPMSGADQRAGKPLLAGDPHLRVQLPTTFYLADIEAGDLHVSGATLPGLPVVVFGHNRDADRIGSDRKAEAQEQNEEEDRFQASLRDEMVTAWFHSTAAKGTR